MRWVVELPAPTGGTAATVTVEADSWAGALTNARGGVSIKKFRCEFEPEGVVRVNDLDTRERYTIRPYKPGAGSTQNIPAVSSFRGPSMAPLGRSSRPPTGSYPVFSVPPPSAVPAPVDSDAPAKPADEVATRAERVDTKSLTPTIAPPPPAAVEAPVTPSSPAPAEASESKATPAPVEASESKATPAPAESAAPESATATTPDAEKKNGSHAAPLFSAAEPTRTSAAPTEPLPTPEVLFERDEDPGAANPLTYRERVFVVPEGTSLGQAEQLARQTLVALKRSLVTRARGRYVTVAVFDHRFSTRPTKSPLVVLRWRDWRGDAPEVEIQPPLPPVREPAPEAPSESRPVHDTVLSLPVVDEAAISDRARRERQDTVLSGPPVMLEATEAKAEAPRADEANTTVDAMRAKPAVEAITALDTTPGSSTLVAPSVVETAVTPSGASESGRSTLPPVEPAPAAPTPAAPTPAAVSAAAVSAAASAESRRKKKRDRKSSKAPPETGESRAAAPSATTTQPGVAAPPAPAVAQPAETKPAETKPVVEAAKPAETAPVAEATKPIEATKPAEVAPVVEATKPAEVAPVVEATKPAEVAPVVEDAKPAEVAPVVEAAKPSETAAPAEATKPVESTPVEKLAEATDAVKPAESTKPAEVLEAAKPAEVAEAAKPAEPAKAAETTDAAKPAEPAKPTSATESTKPATSASGPKFAPGVAPRAPGTGEHRAGTGEHRAGTGEHRAGTGEHRAGKRLRGSDLLSELFDQLINLSFLNESREGCEFIARLLHDHVECSGAVVSLYDINKDEFEVAAVDGVTGVDGRRLKATQGGYGVTVRRRQAHQVGAAAGEDAVSTKWEGGPVLFVPAYHRERLFALVQIGRSMGSRSFDSDERDAAVYVMNQLGEFLSTHSRRVAAAEEAKASLRPPARR